MLEFDFNTVIRVRENRIILRSEPALSFCRPKITHENLKTDRLKTYSGYLSKSSYTVIEKRCQCWFGAIFINNRDIKPLGLVRPYMPVMITVTLASKQIHSDKYIKKHILQEFLKALSRKKNVKYTLWKAEAQKNGNIHFHIIVDKYLDKTFVQGLWNYYQGKHGYLDKRISEGLDKNAPSTKITGMQSNKSPIAYLLKYVGKQKSKTIQCKKTLDCCLAKCKQLENVRRPINGAVFRFSSALISLCPETIYTTMDLHEHLNNKITDGKLRYCRFDYCEILYCNKCKAYDQLTEWYQNEIDIFYRTVYEYLYINGGIRELHEQITQAERKPNKAQQLRLNINCLITA